MPIFVNIEIEKSVRERAVLTLRHKPNSNRKRSIVFFSRSFESVSNLKTEKLMRIKKSAVNQFENRHYLSGTLMKNVMLFNKMYSFCTL